VGSINGTGSFRGLFGLLVAAMALLALAPSAFAAKTTVATIGTEATGVAGATFNVPRGIAVNQTGIGGVTAGTFYVADATNNRIQQFSPAGAFVRAWGWGVKDGIAEFEVCSVAATCQAGKSGAGAGQLAAPQRIAIDQSNGNLYVSDQGNRRIDVFGSTGTFQGGFGWGARNSAAEFQFCTTLTGCATPGTTAPATGTVAGGQFGAAMGGLAVDSTGKVYLANTTSRRVDVFQPTLTGNVVSGATFVQTYGWGVNTGAAAFEVCTTAATCKAPAAAGTGAGQFATNSPTDLSIDSENNVFALDAGNKRVQEFSSVPAPITATFGAAALTSAFGTGALTGIVVDAADHVYVVGANSANANKIAVLEMDHTGAAVETHGTDLAPTAATGLAVAKASLGGNIYVASNNGGHRVYVLNEKPTMEAATAIAAHGATLNGRVISNNLEVKYHFEYSTDGTTWVKAPAADASVVATPGTVAVQQAVTGLLANTKYFVRLVATRPAGGLAITSAQNEFTTLGEMPLVGGTLASEVNDTSARLIAYLNPNHQATLYHFEYGTTASYGNSIPVPEASAGAGVASVPVSQVLTGLSPSTTYHFRVVATNATEPVNGPDRTFTTRAFPVAPENRVYEMISPLDKNGAIITSPVVLDNNHTYFNSSIAFEPDDPAVQTIVRYLGTRSSSGWKLQSGVLAAAPIPNTGNVSFEDFSADFSKQIAEGSVSLLPEDTDHKFDVYLKTATGVELVSTGSLGGNAELAAAYMGESKDASHILFESTEHLEPADSGRVATQPQLYERFNGQTRVVALNSAGNPIGTGGAVLGNGRNVVPAGASGAVSDDGSRVFFEAPCPAGQTFTALEITCATPPPSDPTQLYVRENAQTTVNVGAPERSTPGNAPQTTTFQGATADGSKVLFTTTAQLVDGDTDTSNDLYLYDFNSPVGHRLTRISGGAAGTGTNAAVTGVAPTTSDLRRIYFTASGVLAPGGVLGNGNLYLYDGQENTIKLVVSSPPSGSGGGPIIQTGLRSPTWGLSINTDGSAVVFEAKQRLTEYDNKGLIEIYMYKAATGEISCVSCNPRGEAPLGKSSLNLFKTSVFQAKLRNRSISDDGSTVVFQSFDALVPQDTNGTADVYVWHEGVISLITLGTGNAADLDEEATSNEVGGITPDGKDILFTTFDQMVEGDTDIQKDVYDARIGGGFHPQGAVPPCADDSCQGQPLAAPEVTVPGSAGLVGGGNVSSPKTKKCAKGTHRVNSGGKTRCVKTRHRKKHAKKKGSARRAAPASSRSGS
jgi:Tol biopolymer transport system component